MNAAYLSGEDKAGRHLGLAKYFSDPKALEATETYAPLPVLGIPGWTADNDDECYYEDTQQFRPGRRPAEEQPGAPPRRVESEAPRGRGRKK